MDSEHIIDLPREINDLSLVFSDGALSSLSISEKYTRNNLISIAMNDTGNSVVEQIISQLEEYFSSHEPFQFENLAPEGTPFQRAVWLEISEIPFGEVRTYGDVAKRLKSGARAVGNACRKNPILIIIPCHRVVSAKGLGGYAGATGGRQLELKRWLLMHEEMTL